MSGQAAATHSFFDALKVPQRQRDVLLPHVPPCTAAELPDLDGGNPEFTESVYLDIAQYSLAAPLTLSAVRDAFVNRKVSAIYHAI